MKKYTRILGISVLCLGLALTAPMSVWAAAATEDQAEENQTTDWVFDEYGLLSGEEKEELNQELADIYEEYEYDAILLISQDIESDDARQYAAKFMQDNEIGYGDTHEGMCIFNQPDKRNITIVFRGDTQNDFTETIQDLMLDNCQEKLKEGDMIGGYKSLISNLKKGLARVTQGKKIRPLDVSDSSLPEEALIWLIISFAVMAVPTLIMTLFQVHKMKTRVPQPNANAYEGEGGLRLTEERDMFLYSTVSRTEKPKDKDNDSGSSGSFTSGGESFSGSSRDY
nr:TPM domain-containing protein [uncultured Blautia sp.]